MVALLTLPVLRIRLRPLPLTVLSEKGRWRSWWRSCREMVDVAIRLILGLLVVVSVLRFCGRGGEHILPLVLDTLIFTNEQIIACFK